MLGTPAALPTWLALVFVVQALAVNILWFVVCRRPPAASRWLRRPSWRALAPVARLAIFLAAPYLALVSGVATTEQFALAWPDVPSVLAAGLPIVLAAFAAVALVLLLNVFVARRFYPAGIFPALRSRALLSQPWGAVFILLEALCLQAHWLLFRAGSAVFFADMREGVAAGLALALAGWLLDLRWWHEIRRPGLAEDHALVAALAITSAFLYLAVANFWVLLVAHALLWLGWVWLLAWWNHILFERAREPRLTEQ